MDYKRVARILKLLKEAESKAHKDLSVELLEYAKGLGFTDAIDTLPSGLNPDVLQFNSKEKYLFLGDAKNSDNEAPNVSATYDRINKYINEFSDLLAKGVIKGGLIVIATDNEEIANDWKNSLNVMAMINDLLDSKGFFAKAEIERINDNTWIIII
ncbi:MAG: hypothetical protein WC139_00510 [Candidatus Kapaibacterium sp.]